MAWRSSVRRNNECSRRREGRANGQDRSGRPLRAGLACLRLLQDIRPDAAGHGSRSEMSAMPAADVCLFSLREVYYVGLSFLQYASTVGRLVRHAAWRADRGIAMVSAAARA